MLFRSLAHQGFRVATRAPDVFGRLLVVGIVMLLVAQAFLNMAAMIKIGPVLGITLPFVSHGGSALLFNLIAAGILLSVSRSAKRI